MRNIYALFLIIAISGMLLVGTVAPALAKAESGPGMDLFCDSPPLNGVIKWFNPAKSIGRTTESTGMTGLGWNVGEQRLGPPTTVMKMKFFFYIPYALVDSSWTPSLGDQVEYCQSFGGGCQNACAFVMPVKKII